MTEVQRFDVAVIGGGAAEGVSAAIAINGDLVAEDARRAVAAVERV